MTAEIEMRLVEIETKITYQDDTILALNDVVTQQQKQIDELNTTLKLLVEQIRQSSATETEDLMIDEKPPHY